MISLSFGMIVSILLPKILPSNEVVLSEGFTDVEQGPEEIVASSTGTNVSTGQTLNPRLRHQVDQIPQ